MDTDQRPTVITCARCGAEYEQGREALDKLLRTTTTPPQYVCVNRRACNATIEQAATDVALGAYDDHMRDVPRFDEGDCGGVFDGFQVTSDADPGL